MTKIERWSALYGIPASTLTQMIGTDDTAYSLLADTDIAFKIAHTNSKLVQELLAALPPPQNQKYGKVALEVDFLFPNSQGWHQVFEGMFHPKHAFEDTNNKGTLHLRSDGLELYVGETITDLPQDNRGNLLTYFTAQGVWKEGMQKLIQEWVPRMIEKSFFIDSLAIGRVYSEIIDIGHFSHKTGGVGDHAFGYSSHQPGFDMSAGLWVSHHRSWWTPEETSKIEEQVHNLNQDFFSIKYGKTEIDPTLTGLAIYCNKWKGIEVPEVHRCFKSLVQDDLIHLREGDIFWTTCEPNFIGSGKVYGYKRVEITGRDEGKIRFRGASSEGEIPLNSPRLYQLSDLERLTHLVHTYGEKITSMNL